MTNATFYGQRLRTARNFQGLSLEDVGEKVGATRQYLQQIETNATKQPTQEMVHALASVLLVRADFFFRPEVYTVTDDQCHFRKLHTTPISIKNQALAYGTLFDELIENMDQVVRFPRVNFPQIAPRSFEEIEEIAVKCRQHWKLGIAGPIKNMVRVAENAGALITHFSAVSEKVDAFSMQRKRPLIIRNDAKPSACRQRFDIAHECGHIVMHTGIQTGDKKTEDEANRFASALLLPTDSFLKEFPRKVRLSWAALYEMKLRWKVSVSAIVRRAYDLGLLDAAQYRIANVHLRKKGESRLEIYDDRYDLIPMEAPEAIPMAFEALEQNAPELIVRILREMQIDRPFLEKLINHRLKTSDVLTAPSVPGVVKLETFRKT